MADAHHQVGVRCCDGSVSRCGQVIIESCGEVARRVAPLRPHQRRRMLRRVAQGKSYKRRYSQQDLIRLLRNELERAGAWGGFPGPIGSLPNRLNFIA